MRAMAQQQPPTMPPPDVDLEQLMQQQMEMMQNQGTDSTPKPPPSMTAMTTAEQITAPPFVEGTLDTIESSPTIKAEYEKLCEDHSQLIEFGGRYASFDPLGKLYYLDQIEAIQERWDVFFARFSLLQALNKDYIDQCNAFLGSMGMTEDDYRKLLKKCHELMRQDAEDERKQYGL